MRNQNNELECKCTIIIPTYNRSYHLKRILNYYNEYGRDYNIIVADSSSDENKRINKKNILSISKIEILHLDNYSTEITPHAKFAGAVNHVNTKYCVFCADDDFITPKGIVQSIDFLEKNPDFVTAQGKFIMFKINTDKTRKQQFYWETKYRGESFDCADLKDRLKLSVSSPDLYVYFYGIYRKDFLNFALKECMKYSTGSVMFDEFFFIHLPQIYGKLKNLDVLYGIREINPIKEGDRRRVLEFMEDGTYDERYNKLRSGLATHISKNSELDIEKSKELVDELWYTYLKKYISFKPAINRKMKKIMPAFVYNPISSLYRKLFSKDIRNLPVRYKEYSSKYYGDINRIRDYILQYPPNKVKTK